MIQKKYSSCLSRQSNMTKPSTKLVLVSQEQLFYFQFSKQNKKVVFIINLFFKKINFSLSQITVDTMVNVRNEKSKHYPLKSVKVIPQNCIAHLYCARVSRHQRAYMGACTYNQQIKKPRLCSVLL